MNKLVLTLLIIALICFSGFFFLDRIIIFSLNNFTDFEISYDRLKGTVFRVLEADGLRVRTGENEIGISANKAFLSLEKKQLFERRKVMFDCVLQDARFLPKEKDKIDVTSEENVLAVPFSPEQEYEKITFSACVDKKTIEILNFKADSRDILMEGSCVFSKNTDRIALDWKISFSPEVSSSLPEDVRSGVLSLDENGWYSTIISYKGNMLMLKALYSLTM
ncbi:MAG: hypothetical protein WBC99_00065 [Candidatus Omnitrophota bacterium]